jgi:hypothetical protein
MDAERFLSRHGRDIDPELGERPVRDETAERMENRHTSIDVTFNFDESGRERDGWGDGIVMVGDRRLLEAVCRR